MLGDEAEAGAFRRILLVRDMCVILLRQERSIRVGDKGLKARPVKTKR